MKKEKKSHFNLWIYVVITICILSSSIAYSALNATLKITGDVTISKAIAPRELSKTAVKEILKNNQITTVYINSSSAPPFDTWYDYDVSVGGDESVKATIYKYNTSSDLYITAINEDDNVDFSVPIIMPDCDTMFKDCTSLLKVSFGSAVDFSQVKWMDSMFYGCSNLTTVSAEGSRYEAPKLNDMYEMFYDCPKLIDISDFMCQLVTSAVDEMDYMFFNCNSIETVDLAEIKVAANLTANFMFCGCSSLRLVYLSKADFSQCTAYTNFFNGIPSGVTIHVLDAANKTWFNNRLSEVGRSGNIIIG